MALAAIAVGAVALSVETGPVKVAAVSPGGGETLTGPPAEISVMFTRAFEAREFHLSVATRAGAAVSCGQAEAGGRSISVPVMIADPGLYLVAYHVVLSDGSQIAGATEFTVVNGRTGHGVACASAQTQSHHGGQDPLAVALTILAALLIVILLSLLVWRRLPSKA